MSSAGELRPGPVPSASSRAEAEKAQELIASQLADVRKAAESWRTGLLATLGLVTTVAVVKGRESFTDLDLLPQILIGAALLVALALAAIGSWQAMRAAYGDPQPRATRGGVLTWDYQDSANAVRSLNSAKILLFAALAAITVAVGITWYWPSSAPAMVRADLGSDEVCGSLRRADANRIVIREDGSDKTFETDTLTSLAIVDGCD